VHPCPEPSIKSSSASEPTVKAQIAVEGAARRYRSLRIENVSTVLDHSGIVWNCWTGALAHLGVTRANALQSRTSQRADADAARVRALAACKASLTLWEDAYPDIPILQQAKAAKLK